MTKHYISKQLIVCQLIVLSLLMFMIVGDEVFDFPHTVFNAPSTPIIWNEAFIEGGYVLALAVFSLYLTQRLLKLIQYLEGFWAICSFCIKIRVGEDGKPIEDYISAHSAAEFSHGLYPDCAEKHYVFFRKRRIEEKPASSYNACITTGNMS